SRDRRSHSITTPMHQRLTNARASSVLRKEIATASFTPQDRLAHSLAPPVTLGSVPVLGCMTRCTPDTCTVDDLREWRERGIAFIASHCAFVRRRVAIVSRSGLAGSAAGSSSFGRRTNKKQGLRSAGGFGLVLPSSMASQSGVPRQRVSDAAAKSFANARVR